MNIEKIKKSICLAPELKNSIHKLKKRIRILVLFLFSIKENKENKIKTGYVFNIKEKKLFLSKVISKNTEYIIAKLINIVIACINEDMYLIFISLDNMS
jgi:hypothetical protein